MELLVYRLGSVRPVEVQHAEVPDTVLYYLKSDTPGWPDALKWAIDQLFEVLELVGPVGLHLSRSSALCEVQCLIGEYDNGATDVWRRIVIESVDSSHHQYALICWDRAYDHIHFFVGWPRPRWEGCGLAPVHPDPLSDSVAVVSQRLQRDSRWMKRDAVQKMRD